MFSPTTETTNERMSPKKQGQGSSTLDEKPWTKDCGILSLSLSLSLSLLFYILCIYISLSQFLAGASSSLPPSFLHPSIPPSLRPSAPRLQYLTHHGPPSSPT